MQTQKIYFWYNNKEYLKSYTEATGKRFPALSTKINSHTSSTYGCAILMGCNYDGCRFEHLAQVFYGYLFRNFTLTEIHKWTCYITTPIMGIFLEILP